MINNLKRFISPRVKTSTFSCIRCGNCCKFSEIILSNREIRAISNQLHISISEFTQQYLIKKEIHKIRSIFSDRFEIRGEVLVLKKNNQNLCPFYKKIDAKATCDIYHFRPIVCRLYPFTWKTSAYDPQEMNVAIDFSQNGWDECLGINNQGKSWDQLRDEITGAVLLSIIQSNELIADGFLTQIPK
ncbi:MAG TPA: YkgJ family cysteine cluster protein [Candidatus Deferrimicrobium sp.]|nr:YkgJ family cysteine cluster protein [Candidatus Deferrimicrobium sp.]